MSRPRARLALLAAAAAAFLVLPSSAVAAAPANCPTFRVLHDDRIGMLELPKGTYRMKTSNADKISCSTASRLFTGFLEDYNGILQRPWRYEVYNVGKGRFIRGRRGPSFSVAQITGHVNPAGGGGRHPDSGPRCRGTFMVLHNDRIGRLRLRRGDYTITLLNIRRGGTSTGLSCRQASSKFTSFLEIPSGNLPDPWVLYPGTGSFRRGPKGPGFRVKPAG